MSGGAALGEEQQEAVSDRFAILEQSGPTLGEPIVKKIENSELTNLKELRVSAGGKLRILFVFDPRQSAILLLGGDKTGRWIEWYEKAIPEAERLYAVYLHELREEGVIDG